MRTKDGGVLKRPAAFAIAATSSTDCEALTSQTIIPAEYPAVARATSTSRYSFRGKQHLDDRQLYFQDEPGNRRDGRFYSPVLEIRMARQKARVGGNVRLRPCEV